MKHQFIILAAVILLTGCSPRFIEVEKIVEKAPNWCYKLDFVEHDLFDDEKLHIFNYQGKDETKELGAMLAESSLPDYYAITDPEVRILINNQSVCTAFTLDRCIENIEPGDWQELDELYKLRAEAHKQQNTP